MRATKRTADPSEREKAQARYGWLTTTEAGKLAGASADAVRAWIDAGDMKALNVGSERRPVYRVRPESVEAVLARDRYGEAAAARSAKPENPEREWGVYALHDGLTQRVKIGLTGGLNKRTADLRRASGLSLELLGWFPTSTSSEARDLERALHAHFADRLVDDSLEWFWAKPTAEAFIHELRRYVEGA